MSFYIWNHCLVRKDQYSLRNKDTNATTKAGSYTMFKREIIELNVQEHFYDTGRLPVLIRWSSSEHASLYSLGSAYFKSAYYIAENIITGTRDNIKFDMWFLPCMYLFRQSLELTIKALAAKITEHKRIEEMLIKIQHNLVIGLEYYFNNSDVRSITLDEYHWIKEYIYDIEAADQASDLFRYPFSEKFLKTYKNGFLDIVVMVNGLINAYTILVKEYESDPQCQTHGDPSLPTAYIVSTDSGLTNCYLWEPVSGNRYMKQITGYSEVAYELYQRFVSMATNDRDSQQIMPILFLLRNCIELQLKELLHIEVEQNVDDAKLTHIKNSHVLYRELWKTLRPVLDYYGSERGYDDTTVEILDHHIKELSHIDKNGDMFRYPFSYNLQYRLCDKPIHIDKAVNWMLSIIDSLDGCSFMLSEIAEYNAEMLSYYE